MTKSPSNIVVLSHRIPYPPNKGEKIRTYNQLQQFRNSDCKVTVFCPTDSQQEQELAREYESVSGFKVITVPASFKKLSMLVGLFRGRALTVSNFYNRALQRLIDQHLQAEPVDAIYCTSSAMAEYVFQSEQAAALSVLKLMDFMDLDSDKWRQYREISNFPMSVIYRYEQSMLGRYEQRIQQQFDACIFISSNEVALFESRLEYQAENLHVVGNGVDLAAFKPAPDKSDATEIRLMFSGVMDYLPNENAILWFTENVWDLLRSERPDAKLVIAGMNPGTAVQSLADLDGITVTGYVDDMLACYHDASIFVAPFQIARGVQNKILQSFACGLPVVTTAVGAEGIDCSAGTHYALAESPEQFVEQILRLSDDKHHYQQIADNANELVNRRYTWDAMNARLVALFEQ